MDTGSKGFVLDSAHLYSARMGPTHLNYSKLSNETATTMHNYDQTDAINSARVGMLD